MRSCFMADAEVVSAHKLLLIQKSSTQLSFIAGTEIISANRLLLTHKLLTKTESLLT
jgi:hypothetical protein